MNEIGTNNENVLKESGEKCNDVKIKNIGRIRSKHFFSLWDTFNLN